MGRPRIADVHRPACPQGHAGPSTSVSDSGTHIINWPAQQYSNGVAKHDRTGRRCRKMVRILKNLRDTVLEGKVSAAEPIPSFLSECLVWNVDDRHPAYPSFASTLKAVLTFLAASTSTDAACHEWGEEREMKYLFRDGQQPWPGSRHTTSRSRLVVTRSCDALPGTRERGMS